MFLKSVILIRRNEKKILYYMAPFIFFIYYFIAMPL